MEIISKSYQKNLLGQKTDIRMYFVFFFLASTVVDPKLSRQKSKASESDTNLEGGWFISIEI